MAFGDKKNKDNGSVEDSGTDTLIADTENALSEAADATPKTEIVIPEGFVKVTDFAAELTFNRVAAKVAAGQAPSNDDDYVSVNEVYGWVAAGMPSGHFGEGKQGKRINRAEALIWLESYTPARRGRAKLDDTVKVERGLAKIIEAAKALGMSVEDLLAKVKPVEG